MRRSNNNNNMHFTVELSMLYTYVVDDMRRMEISSFSVALHCASRMLYAGPKNVQQQTSDGHFQRFIKFNLLA